MTTPPSRLDDKAMVALVDALTYAYQSGTEKECASALLDAISALQKELAGWDEQHAKVLTENKRLKDELAGYYRMAGSGVWVETGKYAAQVAALAACEKERDEAQRDLRLCNGHDTVAKFRMLVAERDEERMDKFSARDGWYQAEGRVDKLKAALAASQAALRKYGWHLITCTNPHHDCTCGFTAALSTEGEQT